MADRHQRDKDQPSRIRSTSGETRAGGTDTEWASARAGARAGRGFHYQDVVGASLAISMWAGDLPAGHIVPEGWDDLVLEFSAHSAYLQVKSRQPHKGAFRANDVAAFLVDGWARHRGRLQENKGTFVLVLERPLEDAISGGEHVLATSPAPSRLSPVLSRRVGAERADEILRRSELWVWPDPERDGLDRLAAALQLPQAGCLAHVNALRTAIGEAADKNASSSETDRHGLSVTDVTAIVDQTTSLLDAEGLLEAISRGVCEAVDLITPVYDNGFYLGVDVVPGHVAAGLTVPREDAVLAVDAALRERRVALVAGPSGSGKSAVLWTAAYENRRCRWYRVRRVGTTEDVGLIVRLARAQLPTAHTPIGFVVDNVGQAGTEAWDELVHELSMLPATYLLGAAREEDLFIVSTLPRLKVVRITMDEPLAQSVFEHLQAHAQTSWAHWREPFELSQGLLLEYIHLLSAGVRLHDVIEEQVRTRRREGRNLELRILSIVSTAAAWGAEVPIAALIAELGEAPASISTALHRLVREHLLQQRSDGNLAGLHQVRSRAIFSAIHDHPPPTRAESIAAAIGMLKAVHLQAFLVELLTDAPAMTDDVIAAAAARLGHSGDLPSVVAVLQALRIRVLASQWMDLLEEEDVPHAMRPLTASLAISGVDLGSMTDWLDQRVVAATNRLRKGDVVSPTLRNRLLQLLPKGWIIDRLVAQADCQVAAQLLATVADFKDADLTLRTLPGLKGSPLAAAIVQAPIPDIAQLIASARSTSTETAHRIAELLGGPDETLKRVEQSTPWARKLQIGHPSDELLDGRSVEGIASDALVARVEYRYISDLIHDDVHTETVELARTVMACHPDLELVHVVATDARGVPHGFGGYELANKWLQREALHTDNQIAWNRARIRTIESLLSARSRTDRIAAEPELIGRTAALLDGLASVWITGRGASRTALARLDAERLALIEAIDSLPPPPADPQPYTGPLDTGGESTRDQVQGLLRKCVVNVYSGLLKGDKNLRSVAAMLAEISTKGIAEVAAPEHWRMLGFSGHPQEVQQLADTIQDLASLTAEIAFGQTSFHQLQLVARTAHRSLALSSAARRARDAADRRFQQSCNRLKQEIEAAGARVYVHTRTASRSGAVWPPTDVLAIVEVDRLDRWAALLDGLPATRTSLPPTHSVCAVPMRDGIAIHSFAVIVSPDKLVPAPDVASDWALSEPRLSENGSSGVLRRLLDCAMTLSAIAALPDGERPGPEEEAAEHVAEDFGNILAAFLNIAREHADEPLMNEAASVVQALAEQVRSEFENRKLAGGLARAMLDFMDGITSETTNTLVGTSYLLAEFDVNPTTANEWYAEASQS